MADDMQSRLAALETAVASLGTSVGSHTHDGYAGFQAWLKSWTDSRPKSKPTASTEAKPASTV